MLGCFQFSVAQNFEKTLKYHYNQHIFKIAKTQQGDLLIGSYDKPNKERVALPFATLVDSLANVKWNVPVNNPNFTINRFASDSAANFLFSGTSVSCMICATGYYDEWNYSFISESGFNSFPSILNSYLGNYNQLNYENQLYYNFSPVGTFINQNNDVISVGGDFFHRIGQTVDDFYFSHLADTIIGINQYEPSKCIAFSKSKSYELNDQGNLLLKQDYPFTIIQTDDISKEITLLHALNNQFFLVDTTGAIIQSISFIEPNATVKTVRWFNNQWWIAYETPSGFYIKRFSENGNENWNLNVDTNDFTPESFEVWSNHLVVVGYEKNVPNNHIVTRGYAIDQMEYIPHFIDAGITSLPPITFALSSISHPVYLPLIFYNYTANFEVVVKNFSEETIESLWLNIDLSKTYNTPFFGYCFEKIYSFYFDNLNIQSQEETTITLPSIGFEFYPSNLQVNKPICIWLSAPNSKPDFNALNDQLCSNNFTLTIDQVEFNSSAFSLFPNPAQDFINVNNLNSRTQFEIIDVMGKKLFVGVISESNQTIPISELSAGSYFIRFATNDGLVVKKFIKQ